MLPARLRIDFEAKSRIYEQLDNMTTTAETTGCVCQLEGMGSGGRGGAGVYAN